MKKVVHSGELEMDLGNINDIIDESIKVVWSELKDNKKVKKQLTKIPMPLCHMGEIHQVLMNLCLNVSHACEDKGQLEK